MVIRAGERGLYRQHALLRVYASSLLESEGEVDEISSRYADYFQRFAREKDWRAVEQAFAHAEKCWLWVQAQDTEQSVDYAFAVNSFLRIRGRRIEELEWLKAALRQASQLGQRESEATLLNNIDMVYSDLGRNQDALEQFEKALPILREVGLRWGESVTLSNIGRELEALGRLEEAVAFFEQNVELDEAIGHPDLERDRAKLAAVRKKLEESA